MTPACRAVPFLQSDTPALCALTHRTPDCSGHATVLSYLGGYFKTLPQNNNKMMPTGTHNHVYQFAVCKGAEGREERNRRDHLCPILQDRKDNSYSPKFEAYTFYECPNEANLSSCHRSHRIRLVRRETAIHSMLSKFKQNHITMVIRETTVPCKP